MRRHPSALAHTVRKSRRAGSTDRIRQTPEVKRVAGEVVAYRNPVVLRQQVFPVGIAVGVVHRAERLSEGSCGVGILALCQDVSALVIVSIRYDR